jgi:hypothetical protein
LKTPKSIATRGEGNKARQASSIGLSIRQRSRRCWRLPLDGVDSFLTPTELFYLRSHPPGSETRADFLRAADPGQADKNYLFDALIASIHNNPLQWHLVITVGQPGDPTNDATLPWPPDRQQVDAGTLAIDRVESDDTSPARDINFDPLVLSNGIAGSDDPLLSARSAAYSVQPPARRVGQPGDAF